MASSLQKLALHSIKDKAYPGKCDRQPLSQCMCTWAWSIAASHRYNSCSLAKLTLCPKYGLHTSFHSMQLRQLAW